jgi:hypothetical protein
MVSDDEPVVVNHGLLFGASLWLEIIASYADPMVMNHVVLC